MKILAVDYGDARTGLAVSDPTEFLASPAGIITADSRAKVAAEIAGAVRKTGAGAVVIGLPLNMDGSEGPRAKKSRKLAALLSGMVGVPVELWDERGTTISAAGILTENGTFGAKRKKILDEVAAVVILESYLAHRKSCGNAGNP